MPDYPNHNPPPTNRGSMISVEGDYAPSPRDIPSSFGGNTDLATALEGTLSDMRAVSQQTLVTLNDIGVMAQRITSMLGGTSGSGSVLALPIPNQVENPFSNREQTNTAAVVAQAMGISYGTSMGAAPTMSNAYPTLPPDVANPAFAPFALAPTTSDQNQSESPPPPGDDSSAQPTGNQNQPSWSPATGSPEKKTSDTELWKYLLSNQAIKDLFQNRGGERVTDAQGLSKANITSRIAQYVQGRSPNLPGKGGQPQSYASMSPAGKASIDADAASGDTAALSIQRGAEMGLSADTGLAAGVGTVAEGGSILSGVGAALGPAAGLIAAPLAIGAVAAMGVHEIEAQRAQNAAIQSQIGGSNFAAFGTRAQAGAFGLSNIFSMGMGQSNQAFMGVTDMGLQGGQRSNALDFVMQNYSNMGMSVSDSLELVSASVKSGSANLTQLAGVLKSVSDTAQVAGINTESARQGFSTMFQSAMSGGNMNASNAAVYAQAQQSVISSLGQPGVGLTQGPPSPGVVAAYSGMALGPSEYRQMQPGGGQYTADMAGASQTTISGQINSSLPLNGGGLSPSQLMAHPEQFYNHGGTKEELQKILTGPLFNYDSSYILGMQGGPLAQLWAKVSQPGYLPNAFSVANSKNDLTAFGAKENKIWGGANTSGALGATPAQKQAEESVSQVASVQRWLSGRSNVSPDQAGRLDAMAQFGGQGKVKIGGKTMSVNEALTNQKDIGEIASGEGSYTGIKGKKESLADFNQQHVRNKGPGVTGGSGGKHLGTVTISDYGPIALQQSQGNSNSPSTSSQVGP